MMIYLQLFYEFFKAGLFAIGGGSSNQPGDIGKLETYLTPL